MIWPNRILDSLAKYRHNANRDYHLANAWKAQHPLASIPVIGGLFCVHEYPQWGNWGLVRVETKKFGAGIRLVWDMRDALNSTWLTPIGQSGHAMTKHYSDFQKAWFEHNEPIKVFPKEYDWGLGGAK